MANEVSVLQSELIAVSRLLWDIGSQETTSHNHKVDCYHWGGVLDIRAGLPPWPTPGAPTDAVIEFYEGVERHVHRVIEELRRTAPKEGNEPGTP